MTDWTPPNIIADITDASSAQQLWMKAASVSENSDTANEDWVLKVQSGNLCIVRPDGVSQSVDFTKGKSRHRTNEVAAGAPHLKKALGLTTFKKRHERVPTVIDATGGWGQDAWAIASLGCEVTVMEKHPVVHAILASGLEAAGLDPECAEIEERVTLVNDDACVALSQLHADIIYLDPMYPHRGRKKADSKKGMQILQTLLGPSDDALSAALLDAALSSSANRIVVKRPKGAKAIEPTVPSDAQRFVIESPNTRYDIYQQMANPST
jgi:16S rRNA (guanine1516-N2)-methyltransferase